MRRSVLVVLAASVLLGSPMAWAAGNAGMKRTADAGGVTAVVVPLNLSDPSAPTIDFRIAMDTHSYALAFDTAKIATLKSEKGTEEPASAWNGGRGGHHLSGKLSFPAGALRTEGALTLVLKGAGGGRDLRFTWKAIAAASRASADEGTPVAVRGGSYRNIPPAELKKMLGKKDFFLLNVHVPYSEGIPSTDAYIPFDQTVARLEAYPADKMAKIVVYCQSGHMSVIAATELVKAGYKNVFNLEGGTIAWQKAGL